MSQKYFVIALIVGVVVCVLFAIVPHSASNPTPVASASSNSAVNPARALTIPERSRVAAPNGGQLVLMLDFSNNKDELKQAGANAAETVITTSTRYAEQYLTMPEFKQLNTLVVHVVFVGSMDEYNRANYSSMKRFGTLTFTRTGGKPRLTENKLNITLDT